MPRISNINENNAFVKLQESANGRGSVKLQKNHFAGGGTERFHGRAERYTHSTRNILNAMMEAVPLVDQGTATNVLYACTNTILKVLAAGNTEADRQVFRCPGIEGSRAARRNNLGGV